MFGVAIFNHADICTCEKDNIESYSIQRTYFVHSEKFASNATTRSYSIAAYIHVVDQNALTKARIRFNYDIHVMWMM